MATEIEYCDIDPNNPPQLPCKMMVTDSDTIYIKEHPNNWIEVEIVNIFIGIEGGFIVMSKNKTLWKYCKIPVVKQTINIGSDKSNPILIDVDKSCFIPNDTIKRLWWFQNLNGDWMLTQIACTEKEHLKSYDCLVKEGNLKYAPGPEVPPESEWKRV